MLEPLRYMLFKRRVQKLLPEAESKILEIDKSFRMPPNLKIGFNCKAYQDAKLKQPEHYYGDWHIHVNPTLSSRHNDSILFLLTHELCHYWIGPDLGNGINPFAFIPGTPRGKMNTWLYHMPKEMKQKFCWYKHYSTSYEVFEEMLVDFALTKVFDVTDSHISQHLTDLHQILDKDCTNTRLLKYVESELPHIPNGIKKLLTLKPEQHPT